MKIALIIEHFDPARGGAEAYTVWLAGRLVAAGHEVHVVCHDRGRFFGKYRDAQRGASHDASRSAAPGLAAPDPAADPPGVQIHRLRTIKLSTGLGFRRFGQAVRRWCAAHQPDVVHSMTVAWPGDLYHPHAGIYARLHSQAVASRESPATAQWKRWLLRLSGKQRTLLELERYAARGTPLEGPWKILCVSGMLYRDFQEIYDTPPRRLVLLENPRMSEPPSADEVQASRRWFRQMYHLAESDRVAVFVGHDFRRKGLGWAIRTIATTRRPWTLLVVGLGRARRYRELAEQLQVAERIKFIGPTRRMAQVYSAADALLLPTFYDSFGLVALEAATYGLPVISTRFLGLGQWLAQHGLGVIVESPRAVEAMAAALDAVQPRDAERIRISQLAAAATGDMAPPIYLEKLTDLYRQCAAARSAGTQSCG